MGIALGGIGVISLRVPFTVSHLFPLLDLPSILLAAFIVAVFALIGMFFKTFLYIHTHLPQLILQILPRHLSALFSPSLHFASISHVSARLRMWIQTITTTIAGPITAIVCSTKRAHGSMALRTVMGSVTETLQRPLRHLSFFILPTRLPSRSAHPDTSSAASPCSPSPSLPLSKWQSLRFRSQTLLMLMHNHPSRSLGATLPPVGHGLLGLLESGGSAWR
jgi:hypothetical protein